MRNSKLIWPLKLSEARQQFYTWNNNSKKAINSQFFNWNFISLFFLFIHLFAKARKIVGRAEKRGEVTMLLHLFWNSLISRPLMNLKFHFYGKFFNYLIIRCVLLWTKRGNYNIIIININFSFFVLLIMVIIVWLNETFKVLGYAQFISNNLSFFESSFRAAHDNHSMMYSSSTISHKT